MMISNEVLETNSYRTVLLRALICNKFLPKLAKGTMQFLSTCMGKVMRCHRTLVGMIINRKTRRIEQFEKKSKNDKIKCDCLKCSEDRTNQRKRVLSSDFLASLAYNHRVCNTKKQLKSHGEDVPNNTVANRDCSSSTGICKNSKSNARDVGMNSAAGQAWWASMLERRKYMPPLEDSASKQTESECGSNLGSHLGVTPSSEKPTDNEASMLKSRPKANLLNFPHRNGSKSEPKNLPSRFDRSLISIYSYNQNEKDFHGMKVEKVSCSRRLSFFRNVQRRRGSISSGKWASDRRWKAKNPCSSHETDCVSTRVHWASVPSCKSLF